MIVNYTIHHIFSHRIKILSLNVVGSKRRNPNPNLELILILIRNKPERLGPSPNWDVALSLSGTDHAVK